MDEMLPQSLAEIRQDLKELLVKNLSLQDIKPADIGDEALLFGEEGLGLDSLDAVEIVVMLQRRYGLNIKDMQQAREAFRSVSTLATYVAEHVKT